MKTVTRLAIGVWLTAVVWTVYGSLSAAPWNFWAAFSLIAAVTPVTIFGGFLIAELLE